jgi:hypothetical protein
MLFVVPIAVQILPAGWENVTLGFIFHIGMTWLNEAAHAPSTTPNV